MVKYDKTKETASNGMRDWLVTEKYFCPEHVRKYESIMCQGNGYLGIRAAVEEDYPRNVRYTLVAGTFDRMKTKNTTELPCSADITAVILAADGILLNLTEKTVREYQRTLNLKNGLLHRSFEWSPREGLRLAFASERFVSLANLHTIGQRVTVKVLEGSGELQLASGIRGGERYGEPHFQLVQSRVQEDVLQYAEITHESRITFVSSAFIQVWRVDAAGKRRQVKLRREARPEQVMTECVEKLYAGETLILEKLCRVATSRDTEWSGRPVGNLAEQLMKAELQNMQELTAVSYDQVFRKSEEYWDRLWSERDMQIAGSSRDQLAFRFAVYHLTVMAPLHDNRMNIGAKGLSGYGYQGHSFWDTEIYMLPYFIWENPKGARSLLEYRYRCLDSARKKAVEHGYQGAMYPWEAAWITDGDVCPEPRFSEYEYHVTADVAYGVYSYYEITHDLDFMCRYGCEILFETASFWASRLEYNREKDCYEIHDVIGPDEYTHHADNNAYTNYLAHRNLELALMWSERLRQESPVDYEQLEKALGLKKQQIFWQKRMEKLMLPTANEQNILPQDDTYLSLPEINLELYRAGKKKLREDYPYPSYVKLKVSKQADVMNLFLLMEEQFSEEVKRTSLAYYEPFCVHESSLSLCAYSMLAADCGQGEKAYRLFERAREIDLGPDMKSSDNGIHAASLGGIWQCCVLGFGGIRLRGDKLCIRPRLPELWTSLWVRFWWRGSHLELEAVRNRSDWIDVAVQVLEGQQELRILTDTGEVTGVGRLQWECLA